MNWNDYFAKITLTVSQKSKCQRRQVGCILVKDKRIIATGYNGLPPKYPDCEPGKLHCGKRESGTGLHSIPCVHAEANAIAQCAKFGVSTKDAEAWVTHFPCNDCLKLLISSGIVAIHYGHYYKLSEQDELNRLFLIEQARISIRSYLYER